MAAYPFSIEPCETGFAELHAAWLRAETAAALPERLCALGQQIGVIDTVAAEAQWRVDLPERPVLGAMLRLAARIADIAEVTLAPGPGPEKFHCFAAKVDPARYGAGLTGFAVTDAAGCSDDPFAAFTACIAEAAEYLSQLRRPGDTTPADTAQDVVQGLDLVTLSPALVPAIECLVSPDAYGGDPYRLSSGCAAGRTIGEAVEAAALELIERDAVTGWWARGEGAIHLDPQGRETTSLFEYARALRGNRHDGRKTWLLDIRQTIDLPVVAAISFRPDGTGYTAGYAARLDTVQAGRRAICEMLQMELGLALVEARADTLGFGALSQAELRQVLRARFIQPEDILARVLSDTVSPVTTYRSDLIAALNAPRARQKPPAISIVNLTRQSVGLSVVKATSRDLLRLPLDPVVTQNDLVSKPSFSIPLF